MKDSGDYRYYLEEIRHFKPHTLSEAEEKIVNIKDVTGMGALLPIYDAMTNRYVFKLEVNGEVKGLTRAGLQPFIRGPDAGMRAKAYQESLRVFGNDGPILGQIYQARVRDCHNEKVGLRHFASPIAARNLVNDIPDDVVDTLLQVCERNASIFQRYFRLKARWLGVEKLRRYDIYAPVVKSDKTYSFEQAASLVLDSFGAFSPRVADLARRVFDQSHLDSEVRKGKRGGAFCATVAELCQFVIIGHSERRADFGETDDTVQRKLQAALGHGLTPILCIGETLEENEAGRTSEIITRQLKQGLDRLNLGDEEMSDRVYSIVIAYEPVWAIGTGRAATGVGANAVVTDVIRPTLEGMYGAHFAESVRVLYGGSVKGDNAAEFFTQSDIDGALVGGASLKAAEFIAIVQAAAPHTGAASHGAAPWRTRHPHPPRPIPNEVFFACFPGKVVLR